MTFTVNLPRPLDEELTQKAHQEGVSKDDEVALLLSLANALLKEEKQTPFKEAVRVYLAHHSLDADHLMSVFDALFRQCLTAHDVGKTSAAFQYAAENASERIVLALPLKEWRNSFVHRPFGTEQPLDVSVNIALSDVPPAQDLIQQARRITRQPEQTPKETKYDPGLVARVKHMRGKFAQASEEMASEILQQERQEDKAKEAQQAREAAS